MPRPPRGPSVAPLHPIHGGRPMSTTGSRSTGTEYDGPYAGASSGGGWVLFAGIMLGLAGALNLIDGIAAVSKSKVFVGNAEFVVSDLKTWGWVIIVLGVIQVGTAIGVWTRTRGVRWVGVTIAGLN